MLDYTPVLGILRQHHAAAWVESDVGKGTTMHVYFPVKNLSK
jgi:signal transduction histidine kinase